MKFKAVVFDMDGVMFDTESVCMKSWDTVGEEMGIGKAGYMVYKTLGMTAQAAIKILQNEFGKDFDAKLFKQKGREYSYKYFNDFGVPEKPFLHEAPLMFIPAGVGLMKSWGVLKPLVVPVLAITVVSLIAVMAVSGRVSQKIIAKNDKKRESEGALNE